MRVALRDVVREEVRAALSGQSIAETLRNAGDGYVSVGKAAQIAAVAPGTIRAWIRAGRLQHKRAGRVLRVGRADLERFMSHGAKASVAETSQRAAALLARKPRQALRRAGG